MQESIDFEHEDFSLDLNELSESNERKHKLEQVDQSISKKLKTCNHLFFTNSFFSKQCDCRRRAM